MSQYLAFVAFAAMLAIAPGPDSFLTLRSTVAGGRRRGMLTASGIFVANIVQGTLVACGLGAVLARSEAVFAVIRWAGVAYLLYLGVTTLRAALRRDAAAWDAGAGTSRRGWVPVWQGFLCNITNPKVLAFNLALLPQFVGPGAGVPVLLGYALTLAVLGAVVLLAIVWAADAASSLLRRRRVRRGVEGATGAVMLGFAGALAAEA
ncbi:LysE family translocator [Luteipulveratus halotolerans]|uniref:Lysine transporter LysE n=1 Tax=Luteipulveratus halotolerans TaxID=1631356 RepID=A0A0L6CI91_9MICO|nr:LysE family translocator [Luteipulveratus halotolerans]KNX37506.1 lysine transporter LysE [Luteipulveratus halotolerans]